MFLILASQFWRFYHLLKWWIYYFFSI